MSIIQTMWMTPTLCVCVCAKGHCHYQVFLQLSARCDSLLQQQFNRATDNCMSVNCQLGRWVAGTGRAHSFPSLWRTAIRSVSPGHAKKLWNERQLCSRMKVQVMSRAVDPNLSRSQRRAWLTSSENIWAASCLCVTALPICFTHTFSND